MLALAMHGLVMFALIIHRLFLCIKIACIALKNLLTKIPSTIMVEKMLKKLRGNWVFNQLMHALKSLHC